MSSAKGRISKVSAVLAVLLGMTAPVFATGSSGIEVGLDSARVLAKGNTGGADAQDASTQIYNPAGLSRLDHSEVLLGTTMLVPNFEYTSANGASESGPTMTSYIPTVAIALKTPVEPLSIGLSVNSPYGLANQYSSTGNFKYIGFSNEVKEIAYTINAAYAITPALSVAGGFTYADVDLRQNAKLNATYINNSNGVGGTFPDPNVEIDTEGHGYGWNAALFWQATERLSLGAVYRSKLSAHVEGEYNVDGISDVILSNFIFGNTFFRTSVDTDVVFPDSVVVGASYALTDKTTIAMDLGWTGWSHFEQFDFTYGTANAVLNLNDPLKQRFDDAISVNVGVSHKLNEQWTILGGYAFFEKAATESDYSNVFPDGDRHNVTTGFEVAIGPAKLSLAYAYQFMSEVTVDNSVGAATAGVSIDGKYDNEYHIVTASVTYPLG